MPHHSTTRVLTTHVGSLIRPDPMVAFLKLADLMIRFNQTVNPVDPSQLFVGFEGDGVYTSSDVGATWVGANTCLTNTIVEGITMDLSSPRTLYVSTFASVFKTSGDLIKHGSCDSRLRD
jgi:hypothetical protein